MNLSRQVSFQVRIIIKETKKNPVHTICKLRGQNPCIGMELERMLKETGQVEIIDTDYRVCMMSKLNDNRR